jgi:hypothetical protein
MKNLPANTKNAFQHKNQKGWGIHLIPWGEVAKNLEFIHTRVSDGSEVIPSLQYSLPLSQPQPIG